MIHPEDAQSIEIPLGEAVETIRAAIKEGNAAAGLEGWLFLMNASSEDYFRKLSRQPQDNTGAANAMMQALIAVWSLIPPNDDFQPTRKLLDALIAFVVEAPTGKRTHPLFKGKGWRGTFSEGSLPKQHIIGDAMAYVWLLEQRKERKTVSFVSQALCDAGFDTTGSTVSSWKRRICGWDIAQTARDNRIHELVEAGLDAPAKARSEIESIIRGSLKRAVASTQWDATEQ